MSLLLEDIPIQFIVKNSYFLIFNLKRRVEVMRKTVKLLKNYRQTVKVIQLNVKWLINAASLIILLKITLTV